MPPIRFLYLFAPTGCRDCPLEANQCPQPDSPQPDSPVLAVPLMRGPSGEADELTHALTGRVVHGEERGRTINFPTANIAPVGEMLPPDGVYAVRVDQLDDDGGAMPLAGGVTNIGLRPTLADGGGRTVETYILGFAGDLYGERLRLHLVGRLRDEQKFAGIEELKTQITIDCVQARRKLGLPE